MVNNTVRVKLSNIDDAKDFSRICERYDIDVDYIIGRYVIDAKSLLGILSTTIGKIAYVTIYTSDQDVIEEFLNSIYKWIVEESIWQLD